jgi:hypothetical protein
MTIQIEQGRRISMLSKRKSIIAVIFCLTLSLIIFSGCQSKTIKKKNSEEKNTDSIEQSRLIGKDSVPDFIAIAKSQLVSAFGYLTLIPKNDSSGPYVMKKFKSDSINFDLLFYPKKLPKKLVILDSFEETYSKNKFEDFICFAFVYPMITDEKKRDYHDDDAIYPIIVKSYVRKNGRWYYLSSKMINNLKSLSRYKVDIIYSNLN